MNGEPDLLLEVGVVAGVGLVLVQLLYQLLLLLNNYEVREAEKKLLH